MKQHHPAARYGHPDYGDWKQGFVDGTGLNPLRLPGARTGFALDAYNAGYDYGMDCIADYLETQDCDD